MIRMILTAATLGLAGAASAQTMPAPTTPADQPLPHCSATVRDSCIQDERFARDTPNPAGSRDNNALHYPNEAAARAAAMKREHHWTHPSR